MELWCRGGADFVKQLLPCLTTLLQRVVVELQNPKINYAT
jgi:hypothetical protein